MSLGSAVTRDEVRDGGTGRPMSATARGLLAVIGVGALIGLAACGTATVGGAGHPASAAASHTTEPAAIASASAGVPLCAAAHTVDRVAVTRMPGLSASSTHEPVQAGITIRDAPKVRALAAGLCALPVMPHGVLNCPADFAGAFRLVFAAGQRGFAPVGVQESGCRAVTGVGPVRSWSHSPQFEGLLGKVAGGKGQLIPGTHPSSVPTA